MSKRVMTRLAVALVAVWVAMTATAAPIIIPAAPQIGAETYLLIDAATGDVLASENARMRLPPASLTKIMTSYIIADEIEPIVTGIEQLHKLSSTVCKQVLNTTGLGQLPKMIT